MLLARRTVDSVSNQHIRRNQKNTANSVVKFEQFTKQLTELIYGTKAR